MEKNVYDIIRRPLITERTMDQTADRKYTFEVAVNANKLEIKNAVEKVFKVQVERVTTMRYEGKPKRQGVHAGKRSDWKKAIVKLTPASRTIEVFEGLA